MTVVEAMFLYFCGEDWSLVDNNPVALRKLERRIAKAARPLFYMVWLKDVKFTMLDGSKHTITSTPWNGRDRKIANTFLAYISLKNFLEYGFFSTALVVLAIRRVPSKGFFKLARKHRVFRQDPGLANGNSGNAKEMKRLVFRDRDLVKFVIQFLREARRSGS